MLVGRGPGKIGGSTAMKSDEKSASTPTKFQKLKKVGTILLGPMRRKQKSASFALTNEASEKTRCSLALGGARSKEVGRGGNSGHVENLIGVEKTCHAPRKQKAALQGRGKKDYRPSYFLLEVFFLFFVLGAIGDVKWGGPVPCLQIGVFNFRQNLLRERTDIGSGKGDSSLQKKKSAGSH